MNEFVNKFKEQIENFWDMETEEQEMVLSDVLKFANSNKEKFMTEIDLIKFDDDFMALPIISEALSKDTENWGQFYVNLLNDILETAKKSDNPDEILSNLMELAYIEEDNRPFVQIIVDRLYKELDSDNLNVKLASIWTLPSYLENKSIRNKGSIIRKLQDLLYDKNWKVRVVAFKSLGYGNLLPEGFKLSFKDKLTKLILGEPIMV
ncbi:MAG: hypothetical protein RLZZ546_190 [Bacteroidota bacterium]|jgi:hypothetical protein